MENDDFRLEMRGVSKRYGATVALDGVDFHVGAGEVHALVGENGAGKSTLVKVLSGAVCPDSGKIRLEGKPFAPRNPIEGRRAGVAMIYQELSLAPHLSVEDNILLGMEPSCAGVLRPEVSRNKVAEALAFFEHPELSPSVLVGRLPVSCQQLVEIARAMVIGCKVLVLDEPTSSLAHEDVERLFRLIKRLKSEGHSIIYISHFIEEVQRIADRLTILRDGKSVGTHKIDAISASGIVASMVGHSVDELYPRSARETGETLLTLETLAGMKKPESASLVLRRGEVLGVAGLVGAGRSEMLRAVFGLDRVRSGEIHVGMHCGEANPERRLRQGLGLLSEDRKNEGLALSMSIADNVTLSRLEGMGALGLVLPSRQEHATQRWIHRLAIRCRNPRQPVQAMSGGNQQKVAFARMLHHDVDIWLLDEPTRGIDVASKAQIYSYIDALAKGADGAPAKAILVVSSYLPELLGICDRIAVMCRGKLGDAKPVGEWDEHSLMMAATGETVH